MISIETEGKALVAQMSRQAGASTVTRLYEGKIRVEVANGARGFVWTFERIATEKARALREIEADMRQALRRVGLSDGAAPPPAVPAFADQVRRTPQGIAGPLGSKIRDAIVKRVGKPMETDQPEVSFPHVEIPERKVPKETRALRKRIEMLEREMADVKQVTDQLR